LFRWGVQKELFVARGVKDLSGKINCFKTKFVSCNNDATSSSTDLLDHLRDKARAFKSFCLALGESNNNRYRSVNRHGSTTKSFEVIKELVSLYGATTREDTSLRERENVCVRVRSRERLELRSSETSGIYCGVVK
jgi:hypothetical protein